MSKKSLDVKIGTKMEAFWTDVKRKCEAEIDVYEKTILLNKEILKIAEEKIEEEQEESKKKSLNKCSAM